jgi:hypothetical protein
MWLECTWQPHFRPKLLITRPTLLKKERRGYFGR